MRLAKICLALLFPLGLSMTAQGFTVDCNAVRNNFVGGSFRFSLPGAVTPSGQSQLFWIFTSPYLPTSFGQGSMDSRYNTYFSDFTKGNVSHTCSYQGNYSSLHKWSCTVPGDAPYQVDQCRPASGWLWAEFGGNGYSIGPSGEVIRKCLVFNSWQDC